MAGALRKTMLYLGLADDRGEDEQDEYVDELDETGADVAHDYQAPVTPLHRALGPREVPQTSMSAAELRRITTVHPRSYNDARVIGEAFRGGTPVIMNLSDMDDADAKRLVDFSAGLAFALRGSMDKITSRVFLLSPPNVDVTAEDRRKLAEGGFGNHG